MARKRNPYSVHPAVAMMRSQVEKVEEKTGRTLPQWIELVRKRGPAGEKERRAWLAKEHGLQRSFAWWIAERASGTSPWGGSDEEYLEQAVRSVDAQYSGPKAALRPIYDRLLELGLSLGKDVRVSPCETMVPFFRKYAFAEVHASTNTRVDLHLALGDAKPSGRLEKIRTPSGERVGHRIGISSPGEIDGEVERWLRAAYEAGDEARRREVPSEIPAELAAALKGNAKARAFFGTLAPGQKGEWIRFIAEARKPETRAKRVARAMDRLAAGKKTTY